MYLLDPETGEKHRREIRQRAGEAYETAAESAAAGWEAVREKAGPATTNLRARLSDRLADASRVVAPQGGREYGVEEVEEGGRMELTPAEAYTAVALSRRSRELHGEAREAYARARDLYYDALIDLDLARSGYRGKGPKRRVKGEVKKQGGRKSRAVVRKSGPDYLTISLVAAGCCAAGAAAMFILDPSAGRRRRALARDKAYSAVHRTSEAVGDAVSRSTRYVRDVGQGKMAEAKSAFRHEDVSDEKLEARVRSEMGRVVTHPHHVEVRASNGSVTLGGTVLASEFDALMKCVYGVDGVREVINRVEAISAAAPGGV
jgi:hypothetical protein